MLVQLETGAWVAPEMVAVIVATENDDGDPVVLVETFAGGVFEVDCDDVETAEVLADSLAEEVNDAA